MTTNTLQALKSIYKKLVVNPEIIQGVIKIYLLQNVVLFNGILPNNTFCYHQTIIDTKKF